MHTERNPLYSLIRLRGKLDTECAAWFPELSITVEADGNTLLAGSLPDQSALLGVLSRAHNLNLRILSVEVQEEDPRSES